MTYAVSTLTKLQLKPFSLLNHMSDFVSHSLTKYPPHLILNIRPLAILNILATVSPFPQSLQKLHVREFQVLKIFNI